MNAFAALWVRHRLDILVLVGLLSVCGLVHASNMASHPNWIDDPGTYLSQAWAFQYQGALSPYSYFYDHAPLGWVTIGLYSLLTNGFGRHMFAMDLGNEVMLIAKLISCGLMYLLARRLHFGRFWAAVAVLIFGLNPLALTYSRWTYLDNLVTPWLLLAMLAVFSPRKHLAAFALAGFAFAGAALTKETTLLTAPAFLLAFCLNTDRRTRGKTFAVVGVTSSLMLLYPVYALLKGEFFAGPGHNSLLGTAQWQLAHRAPSGSVLDPSKETHTLWLGWLSYDHLLVYAGIVAAVLGLAVRQLRPLSVLLGCQALVLFTGGYVPYMHIINLLPWMALLAAGILSRLINRASWQAGSQLIRARVLLAGGMAIALGTQAILVWVPADVRAMRFQQEPPLKQAATWVSGNVARDQTVVVHDALWTELVAKQGFAPDKVIIVYKLDSDPAVNEKLRTINFLVLPDYYYLADAAVGQYPTALAAKDRAVPVAHFGNDPTSAVTVYRVSAEWSPR